MVYQAARDLEERALRVSQLAGELAALAEQNAPSEQLVSLHDQFSEQLEALTSQSSLFAVTISEQG